MNANHLTFKEARRAGSRIAVVDAAPKGQGGHGWFAPQSKRPVGSAPLSRGAQDFRGAACNGDARAQAGLEELFRRSFVLSLGTPDGEASWEWIGPRYRAALYVTGVERTDLGGNVIKPGFSADEIEEVLAAEETFTFGDRVKRRAWYFVRAVLLGSRDFVAKHHDQAMAALRLKTPREPKETDCGLFAFRRLRSEGPKAPG